MTGKIIRWKSKTKQKQSNPHRDLQPKLNGHSLWHGKDNLEQFHVFNNQDIDRHIKLHLYVKMEYDILYIINIFSFWWVY